MCLRFALTLLGSLTALCVTVHSIAIDNGVIGLPQVNCEESRVSIVFNTERPFSGRIFIKGMVDKDICRTDYPSNTGTSVIFEMRNGASCNMRRTRRIGPQRGVEQSMTVIISFHDTFITKVDRAYRCTCFFMEADKVVTSRFEVSMLPTTDLQDTARMPLCTYNVRRGSITGPPVAYATVGEEVYHVWQCDSDMFGMLVHSCFVDDGSGGERKQLLDDKGCAIDQVILPELEYNKQTNTAYAEVHVFKFADKVTTYFQCAVSICMRGDGACNGVTPPSCRNSQVGRRNRTRFERDSAVMPALEAVSENHSFLSRETDMDVVADRIVVLDLDDRMTPSSNEDKEQQHLLDALDWRSESSVEVMKTSARRICLSTTGFGVVLTLFVFILTASVSGIGMLYMRHRQQPPLKP